MSELGDKAVVDKSGKNEEESGNTGSDEEEEFEVERVLEMRNDRKGKREFLVRWKNYGPSDDSWEPEANLGGAKEALDKFLAKNPALLSGGKGAANRGNKRGGTAKSATSNNKKGDRGSGTSAPRRTDPEENSDDDDDQLEVNGEAGDSDEEESDMEFEPSKAKKKKSAPGTSLDPRRGKKAGNKKSGKEAASSSGTRQRRATSTSRPVEDSLTKAVNSRIAMDKGNAMSWITSSDDDSDAEGTGRAKKYTLEEIKKNEATIPDLIVGKEQEEMNEGLSQNDIALKKKNQPKENAQSPTPLVDLNVTLANGNDDSNNAARESVDEESAKATPIQQHSKRATRSTSISSLATIAGKVNGKPQRNEPRNNNSKTSSPLENGLDNHQDEERADGGNGSGRNLQKRGGANSHADTASINQKKEQIPVKLVFNSMFRTPSNKLVLVANYGMPSACQVPISTAIEQKMAEMVSEEIMKNDPYGRNKDDDDE